MTTSLMINSIQVDLKKGDFGFDPVYHTFPIVGKITITSLNLTYYCDIIQQNKTNYSIRTTFIQPRNIPFPGEFDDVNNIIEKIGDSLNRENFNEIEKNDSIWKSTSLHSPQDSQQLNE